MVGCDLPLDLCSGKSPDDPAQLVNGETPVMGVARVLFRPFEDGESEPTIQLSATLVSLIRATGLRVHGSIVHRLSRTCEVAARDIWRRGMGHGQGMTDPTTLPHLALIPTQGRLGDGPTAASDDGALLRLATWLAEVSADAAVLATPAANATRASSVPRRAREPKSRPSRPTG
jgi:hypothetical protein